MHAVFFNRSYDPDQTATGQLLTDLAEGLVSEHGWQVTVVTGPPLAPRPAPDGTVPTTWPRRERRNGVDVVRTSGTRFDKRRFAGRAANYLTYYAAAVTAGLRVSRPDVVVALTDPPIIGTAAWLAGRRHGAPLVMVFQDLFPEVASLLPDFHSGTINAGLQRVNQWLVRRASLNIAIGETMRERLIENKGAPPERTTIIHNWADTEAIVPRPKNNPFANRHGLTDRFVVMYSGNIGLSQNLESIVEAAARLADRDDITFVFQGEGVLKAELQAAVDRRGLSNVCFLPFASRDTLADAFASADLFILPLQRGMAGYIVPSKLYGILAAGRPYLAAVEDGCEVARLTRQHASGTVIAPGSVDALIDGILAFHADREMATRAGAAARALSTSFSRSGQVAEYADALERVARRQQVSRVLPASGPQTAGRSDG